MKNKELFKENQTHITMFDDNGTSFFEDEPSSFDFASDEDVLDLDLEEEVAPYLQEGSVFVRKYTIKKFLGQGALGIAYVAEEEGSHNKVVIKEFFPKGMIKRELDATVALGDNVTQQQKSSFAKMKEVFEEEAQNIVTINTVPHKNVAGFVSLEKEVNNTVYYLMPYSEGEELGDYLNRLKKEGYALTQKEIMALVEPILNGLEHIHKYGVYHKDIKPANIYIRKDDEPLLIDFGASVTSAHLLTPSYAPIEQVKRLSFEYGAYTDLYALGVMMYEMVLEKKPLKSKLRADAIARGEKDPYVSLVKLKQLNGKFEKHFLEAIDHALALAYSERPQSAKAMKEELRGDVKRKKRNRLIGFFLLASLIFGILGYEVYEIKRDKYAYLIVPNNENAQVLVDNRIVKVQKDNRYKVLLGEHFIEIKNASKYLSNVTELNFDKENTQQRVENPLIKKEVSFEVRSQKDLVANLEINGEFVGKTPYRGNLYFENLDKKYVMQLKKKGYAHSDKKVLNYRALMVKDTNKINFFLRKKEGTVEIKSPVGFKVKVNGQLLRDNEGRVELTPLSFKRVPGVYTVLLYSAKREKGVKVYKPLVRTIEVKDNEQTLFPQIKAEKSKKYVLLKIKEEEKLSKKKHSPKKEILRKVKVPKMGVPYAGVQFAQTEVTYDELVRFLNAEELSAKVLKKYFYVRSNSLAKYIKKDAGSYYVYEGYENYPVTYVSWYGAKAYVAWLNTQTNDSYRLPSHEEWKEVASRGKGGVVLGSIMEVGSKEANPLKLYDLFANVAEWGEDDVGEFSKVTLGGSYNTLENYLTIEIKSSMNAHNNKNADIGFRVIR